METLPHRCARLLTALEDLAAQEALLIADGDYTAVRAVQKRAAPLVEGLMSAAAGADSGMRRRAAELIGFRERSLEQIAADIEFARAELRLTEESQHRVARIVPVYRQAPVGWNRRQLSARG